MYFFRGWSGKFEIKKSEHTSGWRIFAYHIPHILLFPKHLLPLDKTFFFILTWRKICFGYYGRYYGTIYTVPRQGNQHQHSTFWCNKNLSRQSFLACLCTLPCLPQKLCYENTRYTFICVEVLTSSLTQAGRYTLVKPFFVVMLLLHPNAANTFCCFSILSVVKKIVITRQHAISIYN